jgi:prepilin-type N-terminal cleavage/methylation domain-containing protein
MQKCSTPRQSTEEKGFSLVELIVVVAILGILVIVAIPVYGAIQNTASQTAADTGAANTFTSFTAFYSQEGRDAADAYLYKLNSESSDITYYAIDETLAIKDGSGYFSTFFSSEIVAGGYSRANIASGDSYLYDNVAEGSDGSSVCVLAFLGSSKITHVGAAGTGCE